MANEHGKRINARGQVNSGGDVAAILWSSRRLILAGAILCAAVATVVACLIPPEFESKATLVLLPPPFKEKEDAMSGLIPKVLGVRDYEILLESDGVLMKVASQLREAGAYPEETIGRLDKLSALRRCMSVETSVTQKTAYGTTYSPVIELEARGPTPEFARDLAQAWANIAAKEAAAVYQKGKSGLKVFVEEQLDAAKEELERVNALQQANEAAWNELLANEKLSGKATLMNRFEKDKIELQIALEGLRKENEQLQTQLDEEDKVFVLWKSPPMTAVFVGANPDQKAAPPKPPDTSEGEGYWEEVINATYQHLRQQFLANATRMAGLEEELRRTNEAVDKLRAEVETIRDENARFAREKERLKREASIYSASYMLLAQKLEQAKIAETEQREELADIKIAGDAVLADKKVSPKRSLIVFVATLLGFVAASGGAYMRQSLARVRR